MIVSVNGQESTLENAVTVNQSVSDVELSAELVMPESVREGRIYSATVEYSAPFDWTAPIFVLQGSEGVLLSLTEDFSDATNVLQIVGTGSDFVDMITGQTKNVLTFYYKATRNTHISVGTLSYADTDPCSDTTYFATWKEYHESILAAAVRLGERGQDARDVSAAYQLAVMQKEGNDVNAISGILTNSQTGEAVTDSTLIARWTDDEGAVQYRLAKTDGKGHYCIEYLPKNITVSLSSVDVTGLSQTVIQVGNGDVNKVKLTAIPVDSSYQRTVTVNGDLTAYIEYRQSDLTNNRSAEMKLVVKNTSNTAVAAPLLALSAENGSGQSQAILTLNDALAGTSFTTSVLPNGYSSSIQLVAGGETAGTLQPGESVEIPVYWAGWVKPWDSTNFSFNLGLITESETEALDLAELKTAMRPESITDAAWEIVWGRLATDLGTTWGSYTAAMNDVSQLLAQSGQTVRGVSDLMTVLTASATDAFSPLAQLTVSTDNSVGGSAFALDFSRSCLGTVTGRYTDSALGYGWDYSWNYALMVDELGNATFTGPHGSGRTFQPTRTIGGKLQYRAADTDDSASLVRNADNSYTLTETDLSVCQFSAEGKLLSQTDANGNVLSMTYNAQGQLTTVADTLGNSLTIAWNAGGKIASVTDSNGDTTTYQYDESGKFLTQVTWADGRTIGYTYDDFALTSIAFADGTHRYFTYDDAGRAYESHADNNAESVSYVFQNKLSYKVYQGTEYQGTVWLDASGNVIQSTDALNRTTRYQYNGLGRLVSLTDAAGNVSTVEYDAKGAVTRTVNANGETLAYEYDNHSWQTSLTDAAGNAYSFTYDTLGNLSAMGRADGTSAVYVYNADGTIATATDRAGATTEYAYNADNSVASITYSTETTPLQYEYDARGNVTKITDVDGSETTFTYNDRDQLTKVTYPNGRYLEYVYDSAGRQTSVSDGADYCVKYTYNDTGYLYQVLDGSNAVLTTYAYNANGLLTRETQGNGTYTAYTYDVLGQLTSKQTCAANGTELASFDYTYDTLGLISTLTTLDGQWTYGYDKTGQITSSIFVADAGAGLENQSSEFRYDVAGNRIWSKINGIETTYTYNNMNQLLSDGAFTYTYDANGNLLTKTDVNSGEVLTFAWNQDGQMVSCVSSTSERWDYEYDALGNRTAVTHTDAEGNAERTEYLIDPNTAYGDIVAQFDADGNLVVSYAYGLGLIAQTDSTGADAFYGFDHLGSTAVITDVNGAILNEYAYDQHGNVLAQTGSLDTPFQFVGAYGIVSGDHSELLSMRARWYDPASGRFGSEDPIGLDAGDANLYRYCENGVTMAVDVSGLDSIFNPPSNPNYGFDTFEKTTSSKTPNPFENIPDEYKKNAKEVVDRQIKKNKEFEREAQKALKEGKNNPFKKQTEKKLGESLGKKLAKKGAIMWSQHLAGLAAGNLGPQAVVPIDDVVIQGGLLLWDLYDIGKSVIEWLDENRSSTPQSCDPNEINGLIGYDYQTINTGTEDEPFLVITSPNWITGSEEQAFTIYFENKSSATAAAQEVFVTTMLPEELDWNTFELQEICIGNQVFDDMVGYADGVWTLNQTATGNQIQITCSFDTETGEAKWYLRSWVTTTADHFPVSAYDGFLPPNNKETHDGEGYVKFSINPNSEDLVTNDEITTYATIVFDTNDPIVTNVWRNTIDVTAPTANLAVLAEVTEEQSVTLNWTGADEGSGIASYAIYVSSNGGNWEKVAENLTETTYKYQFPHKNKIYSFKVVATDNVGLVEEAQSAEVSIRYNSVTEILTCITTTETPLDSHVVSANESPINEWSTFNLEFWSVVEGNQTFELSYDSSRFALDKTNVRKQDGVEITFGEGVTVNGVTTLSVGLNLAQNYTTSETSKLLAALKFTPMNSSTIAAGEHSNWVLSVDGTTKKTEVFSVPYDLNDDGAVGIIDLVQFARLFNKSSDASASNYHANAYKADYNSDSIVDILDLVLFARNFNVTAANATSVSYSSSYAPADLMPSPDPVNAPTLVSSAALTPHLTDFAMDDFFDDDDEEDDDFLLAGTVKKWKF